MDLDILYAGKDLVLADGVKTEDFQAVVAEMTEKLKPLAGYNTYMMEKAKFTTGPLLWELQWWGNDQLLPPAIEVVNKFKSMIKVKPKDSAKP